MTILQPAVNTLNPPQAIFGLDPLTLQKWDQAVAQQIALNKNNVLKADYVGNAFPNWLVNYQAGRVVGPSGTMGDPDAPPPAPPRGFVVLVSDDGITCDWQQLGEPVCDVPAYTKIPAPQTRQQAIDNIAKLAGNGSTPAQLFTAAVPMYTVPVTAPDGSKWVRVG